MVDFRRCSVSYLLFEQFKAGEVRFSWHSVIGIFHLTTVTGSLRIDSLIKLRREMNSMFFRREACLLVEGEYFQHLLQTWWVKT